MTPQERIAGVAERLRAGGLPDFLNLWLALTPETLAENESRRSRPIHHDRNRRIPTMTLSAAIGPKEQALRNARSKPAKVTKPKAPAPVEPKATTTPVATEIAVKTSTKTSPASTKKAKPATARRPKAATKAAGRNAARKPKTEGVRPGSKLETIVGLLKRKEGCTTKQVLAAVGWPAVSMPQMARSAGLTLKKDKGDDGVTVYRAE